MLLYDEVFQVDGGVLYHFQRSFLIKNFLKSTVISYVSYHFVLEFDKFESLDLKFSHHMPNSLICSRGRSAAVCSGCCLHCGSNARLKAQHYCVPSLQWKCEKCDCVHYDVICMPGVLERVWSRGSLFNSCCLSVVSVERYLSVYLSIYLSFVNCWRGNDKLSLH